MLLHDNLLAAIEVEDGRRAVEVFLEVTAAGGPLVSLRLRQVLQMLCRKGMVVEASELLFRETNCIDLRKDNLSTMASFMLVIDACLDRKHLNRAWAHFKHASGLAVMLDVMLCENLATALFIAGMEGRDVDGLEKDGVPSLKGQDVELKGAWSVLEYMRQIGMVHTNQVCNAALSRARELGDLGFALRMVSYMDDLELEIAGDISASLYHHVCYELECMDASQETAEQRGISRQDLLTLEHLLECWTENELEVLGEYGHESNGSEEQSDQVACVGEVLIGDSFPLCSCLGIEGPTSKCSLSVCRCVVVSPRSVRCLLSGFRYLMVCSSTRHTQDLACFPLLRSPSPPLKGLYFQSGLDHDHGGLAGILVGENFFFSTIE
ncbi:unnamed protein product [Discosporangium mesarthrocarpum]